MQRPLFIGSMGGPKVGKTEFALSAFDSIHFPPERVLYMDNHGSTDTFSDVPQWSPVNRFGVKHYASDDADAVYKDLFAIRKAFRAGKQMYDCIILDDWSEFAQADIDDRLDDEELRDGRKAWGEHADLLKGAARLIFPRNTGAHHIGLFQAAQMPDPLEPKPEYGTPDKRDTMLRPFLQGQFASYLPFKLDGLFYQERLDKGAKHTYNMRFEPTRDEAIFNRWLKDWLASGDSTTMVDPTFDKVLAQLTKFKIAEEA